MMTRAVITAAVRADGEVFTDNCHADRFGATVSADATDDEIAALVAAAAPDDDAAAWRRGDVARALRERHGDDWPAHIPTSGRPRVATLKTWKNNAAVAAAWDDIEDRRLFGAQGIEHGHFAALAGLANDDRQRAQELLWEAVGGALSVRDLRRLARGQRPDAGSEGDDGETRIEAAARAIRVWADAEGMDVWPSDSQAVSLATAVCDALDERKKTARKATALTDY